MGLSTVAANLLDGFFGYDYFISYAHADGTRYPEKLRERLSAAPYEFDVHLDTKDYQAGDDIGFLTRRRIANSHELIVVARPNALTTSRWVRREVDTFLEKGKVPLLINVDNAIERAQPTPQTLSELLPTKDWKYAVETSDRTARAPFDGTPSDAVIEAIAAAFTASRRKTRRARVLWIATVVLAAVAAVAVWQAVSAVRAERKGAQLLAEASVSEQLIAKDLTAQGRYPEALAHLARAIDYRPESSEAAEQAVGLRLPGLWRAFTLQAEPGLNAAFSPDGSRIVATSGMRNIHELENGSVYVWESATGEIVSVLPKHRFRDQVASNRDGSVIMTASADGKSVIVWDSYTREQIDIIDDFPGEVSKVSTSSDGRFLAVVSLVEGGGVANVYQAATRTLVRQVTIDWIGAFDHLVEPRFDPSGDYLAFGTWNLVKILTIATGNVSMVKGLGGQSTCFSLDGKRIVAASGYSVEIWNSNTGESLAAFHEHPTGVNVNHVEFSPDGSRVLSVGYDAARIWNAVDGEELSVLSPPAGTGMRTATFSPDGLRVATLSAEGRVTIWDCAGACGESSATATLNGHLGGVEYVQFSPDGSRILTVSADGTARLWDSTMSPPIGALRARPLALSPNGDRVVTMGRGNDPDLREVSTGRRLAPLRGHADYVWGAAFSVDGTRIATVSGDHVLVWDGRTGQALSVIGPHPVRGACDDCLRAEFSRDGTRILTTSNDGTARVWNSGTGREVTTIALNPGYRGHFDPSGNRIVMVPQSGAIEVWEAVTSSGKRMLSLGPRDYWGAIAFSDDGSIIVTSNVERASRLDEDGEFAIAVWDAASGALLHDHKVVGSTASNDKCLLLSRDHSRIVTGMSGYVSVMETATGKVNQPFGSSIGMPVCAPIADDSAGTQIAVQSGVVDPYDHDYSGRGLELLGIDPARLRMRIHLETTRVVAEWVSSDGVQLVVVGDNGTVALHPGRAEAVPWFGDFLRLLSNQRFEADGTLVELDVDSQNLYRERVMTALGGDKSVYGDIARWYLSPWSERSVLPGLGPPARVAADALIDPIAEASEILRAYELYPTHPLVHLALASFYYFDEPRAEFLRKFSLDHLIPRAPASEQPALLRRAAELLEVQVGQAQRAAMIRGQASLSP